MTKSFKTRVQCTIPSSPFPWSLQFFLLLSVIEKKQGGEKVKHSWLTAGVTEERFDHPQHLNAVAAQSRDVQGSRDTGWRGGVHDLTALISTCHCLSNVLPLETTKKTSMKKTPMEKTPMKKTSMKKTPMKKTQMEKTPMKKTSMKKTSMEKTPMKKHTKEKLIFVLKKKCQSYSKVQNG